MDSRSQTRDAMAFSQQGFSYLEALIATFIIGLTLVPAIEALQSGSQAASAHHQHRIDQPLLAGKMEQVLASEYGLLATAVAGPTTLSSLSDTVISSDGRSLQRQVYLAFYDGETGDPFAAADTGLLWLRVELAGTPQALETLVSQ
ncbi:type IV pilus modification PilV family protein [Oceanimonas marisflavi]|uniref:type IV pilus modification PilV family protein n=1 Tax=Oceanimonas marisflavi TaxID=2059724 RepID=UPI0013006C88|nr:type II secretion system protein [Oceanimonas marisflavi]